jgi:hypothetical protein
MASGGLAYCDANPNYAYPNNPAALSPAKRYRRYHQ